MKKRRTLIISLLLVAAIALGIGYAAQTGHVTITGAVSNQPHPVKLVFVATGSEVVESSVTLQDGTTADSSHHEIIVVEGTQEATFSISDLAHEGDFITANFVVKNTNEYNVELRDNPANGVVVTADDGQTTLDVFGIDAEWVRTAGDSLVLEPNQTKTLKVTISMDKPTANTCNGRYTLTVYGDSVE